MARTIGSHGPKTLEAIRKAGTRLIFEHGYEAMSLRQLAAEVGIQAGSLYNHISTKQELLFDLVQDHINDLLRQLDRALEGKQGPVEKLRAFVAFHVTYHMTRKREVFIANSELRSLEPKNYEAIVALRGAYERRLAEILSEGVSEGVFDVVDVQVATFGILALLTGLCTWYRPGGRLTNEAIVAAHEKLVLSGVAPQVASSPPEAPASGRSGSQPASATSAWNRGQRS
jgi:AcrR family transcriptional regulator